MKLYYLPISPYSHKVQLALFVKDIECEKEVVIPLDPEQRAVYRELFPLGKLPLLVDGDTQIHESSFIIEHLDNIAGGAKLLPENADGSRAVRYKDRLADIYLSEAAIAIFFQGFRAPEQQDETRIQQSRHRIHCAYRMIENILKETEGTFFHGDSVTMADLSLVPALRSSYGHIPFDDYRYICEYYEKWQQHEGVRQVEKEAGQYSEQFMAFLKG